MTTHKRVLCPQRLRRVPPQFSWIDHRLVRDKYISRCSAQALALYLLLVTVGDDKGLSYYSDKTLCQLLPLDELALAKARQELLAAGLIAYHRPLYQVLSLEPSAPFAPSGPSKLLTKSDPPQSIGQILKQMLPHD
jgi:hypothetical protein